MPNEFHDVVDVEAWHRGRQRYCSLSPVRCGPLSTAHLSSLRAVDLHHALGHDPAGKFEACAFAVVRR